MMQKNGSKDSSDSVKAALDAFRTAWHSGDHLDPDAFCQSHPECGPELREKIDNFLMVVKGFPEQESSKGAGALEAIDKNIDLPKRIIGDFRIIQEIGRGGMGTVFEAEQISLKRRVALKVLSSHLTFSKEAVMKFRREGEAGGRQSHPGIVAVHAVGEHEGDHYIAQELVEGGYTFAHKLEELAKEKDLPIGYFREAAGLFVKIAEALAHAHASGVIHRDVKPSNILITKEDLPKVTDFGLAKVEGALALSRTGALAGTPYYMSPEQAMSRRIKIDHRTDIYSLGVTLYEALTLKRPFEGETSHEVLKKVLSLEPSDPRKKNVRVPRDLAVICLKAMEKDPQHRYQTMKELTDDLSRYLQGEVISARPTGFTTRVWKRVKRNPVVSMTASAALLAVIVLILYVLWSYPQIVEERNKAIEASIEAKQQREAALAAKKKTDKEIEKTKAVNEFLTRMFTSPSPGVDGREVKVVEVLDKVEEEIQKSFTDQPEIEVSVRDTVGVTYISLGLFDMAEQHLKKALELKLGAYGKESLTTLAAYNNLAILYQKQGKYSEAELLFQENLEAKKRILGKEHPNTLSTVNNLANLLLNQGRYSEAEPLIRSNFDVKQRVLGKEHPDTLKIANSLGGLLQNQGKYSEAELLFRENLEAKQRILGKEHPDTLITMLNLAGVFKSQGRYSETESLVRGTLDIQQRVLGKEHPDTLITMHNLSLTLSKLGEYNEAEALLRSALEISQRVLGGDHPGSLNIQSALARLLSQQGKYNEAEPLVSETLEAQKRTVGKDHPYTLQTMDVLGKLLLDQGRNSEAESIYRKLIKAQQRILGEENPDTLISIHELSRALFNQGKYTEVESILRKNIEAMCRVLGVEHKNTLTNKGNLGSVLRIQGRYSEAEPLLRETLKGRRCLLGEDHPNTKTTIKELITLYEAWKKPEKAAEYRAMLVDEKEQPTKDDQ